MTIVPPEEQRQLPVPDLSISTVPPATFSGRDFWKPKGLREDYPAERDHFVYCDRALIARPLPQTTFKGLPGKVIRSGFLSVPT